MIDMQKAFTDPAAPVDGAAGTLHHPQYPIVSQNLPEAPGIPVFWIAMTAAARDGLHKLAGLLRKHFASPEFGEQHVAALTAGAPLNGFADGWTSPSTRPVVQKFTVFSAFVQEFTRSSSPPWRELGSTPRHCRHTDQNRCCESTARDAMMIGTKSCLSKTANARTPARRARRSPPQPRDRPRVNVRRTDEVLEDVPIARAPVLF